MKLNINIIFFKKFKKTIFCSKFLKLILIINKCQEFLEDLILKNLTALELFKIYVKFSYILSFVDKFVYSVHLAYTHAQFKSSKIQTRRDNIIFPMAKLRSNNSVRFKKTNLFEQQFIVCCNSPSFTSCDSFNRMK